jgi:hypothetical protein
MAKLQKNEVKTANIRIRQIEIFHLLRNLENNYLKILKFTLNIYLVIY